MISPQRRRSRSSPRAKAAALDRSPSPRTPSTPDRSPTSRVAQLRTATPASSVGDSPDEPSGSTGRRRAARQTRSPNRPTSGAARRLFHDADASRAAPETPQQQMELVGRSQVRNLTGLSVDVPMSSSGASSSADSVPISSVESSPDWSVRAPASPRERAEARHAEAVLQHLDRHPHGISERERIAGVPSPTNTSLVKNAELAHQVQELRRAKTMTVMTLENEQQKKAEATKLKARADK
eukprot:COSAG06_NODE_10478_length_1676_cov_1.060241_2_plen_238_part_01